MSESPVVSLDARTLLHRVNAELIRLRRALSHDHGDEPFWAARETTAARAMALRHRLRGLADLLHVERATARGRRHGTRFASLDEQRAWLARCQSWRLRAGELPPDTLSS